MSIVTRRARQRTAPIHAGAATMKRGHYDDNSSVQRSDIASSLAYQEQIVRDMKLHSATTPLVLADFGCGTGGSSNQLMRSITSAIQQEMPERSLMIFRNDLQENDFNSVASQLVPMASQGVCEFLAPGTFYEQVFPANSLHFGTCFAAVHWMQRVPQVCLPEHLTPEIVHDDRWQAFSAEWQRGWNSFLQARSTELAPGGQMLTSIIARTTADETVHGPFDVVQVAAESMVQDGHVNAADLERFLLPIHRPTLEETLAPFAGGEQDYHGLTVQICDETEPECPFWAALERDHNVADYATKYTGFIRGFSESSVRSGLFEAQLTRNPSSQLLDCLYERVRQLNEQQPERFRLTRTRILLLLQKSSVTAG